MNLCEEHWFGYMSTPTTKSAGMLPMYWWSKGRENLLRVEKGWKLNGLPSKRKQQDILILTPCCCRLEVHFL